MFCCAGQDARLDFSGVNTNGHSWGELPENWYEESCRRCEKTIEIRTEYVRSAIIDLGGLHWDLRDKAMGLILRNDLPALGLRAKDRLEPGEHLRDIGQIFTYELPVTVTFWRVNRDAHGRLDDRISHRNLLFSMRTGVSPHMVCIDALHTVYLGVYKTYCECIVWGIIECNAFGFEGPFDKIKEMTARRLTSDVLAFWETQGPSKKSRVTRLTSKMLGTRKSPDFKVKAAEAGECLAWALDLAIRYKDQIEHGKALVAAGQALVDWKALIASAADRLTDVELSKAIELAVRHNTAMQAARCDLPPKNHLFIHLNLRMRVCGHPRRYACWVDESINSIFSAVCQASHRLTWETSIFERIRLIPYVLKNSFFSKLG